MGFTATPLDGSSTPIPMSSAVPDGTHTPLALEGGPAVSTGGNTLAPVSGDTSGLTPGQYWVRVEVNMNGTSPDYSDYLPIFVGA